MSALRERLFTSVLASGLAARANFPLSHHLHCAVSGGADSLALLLLACRTESPITAWHVDHSLRTDSSREAGFVKEVADDLGVRFESRTVRIELGANLEARAREARYGVLPPDVLTGHTADDQAETVLINLLRGSGTAGLSGMRRDRRPLLRLRRLETNALCDELGLVPLRDPMNEDDRFQRVRVRHELLGLLVDIAKRDVVELLTRQADVMRDDDDLLEELAAMIDVEDAKALAVAPVALARRAVRQWLANPLPPDAATVERVLAVARGDAIACEVGHGREVRRSQQRLGIRTNDVR
jgi:tRNA(Ile)-lysidine synthase